MGWYEWGYTSGAVQVGMIQLGYSGIILAAHIFSGYSNTKGKSERKHKKVITCIYFIYYILYNTTRINIH